MKIFNRWVSVVLAIAVGMMVGGCATTKDSVLLGTATGMGTGAAVGSMSSHGNRSEDTLRGALIGGAIGALSSYFIHGAIKKRDAKTRRETLFNLEKFGVSGVPSGSSGPFNVSAPVVETRYIEPYIKGREAHEGHYVHIISEDAAWSEAKGKKKKK